jgi:hypothetical protein
VETQAAADLPILIYLTIGEYGSTPVSGDKVRVNFGTSTQHCYEYVGIETGAENTSLVVEYNDCNCVTPSPTPTNTPTPTPTATATGVTATGQCKFFEVGADVDQSRYGLKWVPSDAEATTTGTFNTMQSTPMGNDVDSSVAVGVCTAPMTAVQLWDSQTQQAINSLEGVSTLSVKNSSCDETPLGRCRYVAPSGPDDPTETNRKVTGCTSGNEYVINFNETCDAGVTTASESELQLSDVIWITVGDCGEAVDECASVGQVTTDPVTAIRRGQNIFNDCTRDGNNVTGCYLP